MRVAAAHGYQDDGTCFMPADPEQFSGPFAYHAFHDYAEPYMPQPPKAPKGWGQSDGPADGSADVRGVRDRPAQAV